ncbi:MAG TPA: CsbD family protein [Anaerolineae bacterium]|nr:CsbD family protein [Anaerolineae bacterium]
MDDILAGNWKQMKGQVKEWWGDLTDDDLTYIDGKRDKLVGALQKRYGYDKVRAESEVNRHLDEYQRMRKNLYNATNTPQR